MNDIRQIFLVQDIWRSKLRQRRDNSAALIIQKNVRRHKAMVNFTCQVSDVLLCQAVARRLFASRQTNRLKEMKCTENKAATTVVSLNWLGLVICVGLFSVYSYLPCLFRPLTKTVALVLVSCHHPIYQHSKHTSVDIEALCRIFCCCRMWFCVRPWFGNAWHQSALQF